MELEDAIFQVLKKRSNKIDLKFDKIKFFTFWSNCYYDDKEKYCEGIEIYGKNLTAMFDSVEVCIFNKYNSVAELYKDYLEALNRAGKLGSEVFVCPCNILKEHVDRDLCEYAAYVRFKRKEEVTGYKPNGVNMVWFKITKEQVEMLMEECYKGVEVELSEKEEEKFRVLGADFSKVAGWKSVSF